MASAKERAVEAGARAMNPDAFTLDENPLVQRLAVGLAKEDAEACLRAAFPILAEELVKVAEEEAEDLWQIRNNYIDGNMLCSVVQRKVFAAEFRERAEAVEQVAEALRARIQQMAEAL